MIKRDLWEKVSDSWAKKEEIDIPPIILGEVPPDEPEEPSIGDIEIPFDDIDDLDEFFKDMFNDL